MKKLNLIALALLALTTGIQAYQFSYRNATNKTIYINPYAWAGLTRSSQFSLFNDKDGAFLLDNGKEVKDLRRSGPQALKPGATLSIRVRGVWCHGKILVGTNKRNFKVLSMHKNNMHKANQEQYNEIVSNLTKAAIGSSVATAGASGVLIFAGIQVARFFNQTLCQNYHFIIGKDNKGNYFATATPF